MKAYFGHLIARFAIHFILLFVYSVSTSIYSIEFSITMDDPNLYTLPHLSAEERDADILGHLIALKTKAALFVCGQRIDSVEGKELLKRWDKAGHMIGNHTYSHYNYNGSTMQFRDFSADVAKNHSLLEPLVSLTRVFRFPFLKSGDTLQKRDQMRQYLKKHKYAYGYVTVDASDWYISSRLEARLRQDPNADLSGYRNFYLKHLFERALYYNQLAKQVLGRSPKHTVLVHHNLLNALFLSDLVHHFQVNGWRLVDAKEAFTDKLYSMEPKILPSGESILWALAKEQGIVGLRYPAEDSRYEKDEMDRLGL